MSSNPPKIRHDYLVDPIRFLDDGIPSFIAPGTDGAGSDTQTVTSFGEEWQRFNTFSDEELNAIGDKYFSLVERRLSSDTSALDVGCGSGLVDIEFMEREPYWCVVGTRSMMT